MPRPIDTAAPKPQIMDGEPPAFELEAVGLFIRVGPNTLVRWDEIAGLRGVDFIVRTPPPEPIESEGDEEDDEPEAAPEPAGELRRGTQVFFRGILPMQVADSYGRPAESLLIPFPEGEVLALIERVRRSERSA